MLFVLVFHWGIAGAAFATILAQYVSCIGLLLFVIFHCKELLPEKKHFQWNKEILKEIFDLSILTCAQQSAMNFGILLVQRLVDSFGAVTMAAFASPLMKIFVKAQETDVIACGVRYLRIEGAFYIGIGCLFLLYGLYRAVERPGMSLILTIISLGTRVVLAYALADPVGEVGIWIAIPIGWFLADFVGYGYWFFVLPKRITKKRGW